MKEKYRLALLRAYETVELPPSGPKRRSLYLEQLSPKLRGLFEKRVGFLSLSMAIQALEVNVRCERCNVGLTTLRNWGICDLCLAKDPEGVKKIRRSRAMHDRVARKGTKQYGTPNTSWPKEVNWTATRWGKAERQALKKVAGFLLERRTSGVEATRLCRELEENHNELWRSLVFFTNHLTPTNGIRLGLQGKLCPVCREGLITRDTPWGCKKCEQRPEIKAQRTKAIVEVREEKYRKKHGVTHHMKRPEVVKRLREIWTPEFQKAATAKARQTNIERYGHASAMKNPAIAKKASDAWAQKSEADLKRIVRARKKTNRERYGADSANALPEFQEKAKKTRMERTGYDHNMRDPRHQEMRRQRSRKKWGTDIPSQNPEIRDKIISTMMLRYGGMAKGSPVLRAKIEATNVERYGFPIATMNPEIMAKCKRTWLRIYGYTNPNKNLDQAAKGLRTSRSHRVLEIGGRTFRVQGGNEEKFVYKLVKKFGVRNVHTQFHKKYLALGIKEHWIPDFVVKHKGKWIPIELKSTYTLWGQVGTLERNRAKARLRPDVRWFVEYRDRYILLPRGWENAPNLTLLAHSIWAAKVGRDSKYPKMVEGVTGWARKGNFIYSKERKIGIRVLDSYLDSSLFPEKRSEPSGYRVIELWDHQLRKHRTATLRFLRNLVGKSESVFARKCQVGQAKLKDLSKWFFDNHIQGAPRSGKCYTLEFEGKIVAAMVFARPVSRRGNTDTKTIELVRYATACSVVGGASRLLAAFKRDTSASRIVSYSDGAMFTGAMYEKLGFRREKTYKRDYKILTNFSTLTALPKQAVTRKQLAKMEGFNPHETERQNCERLGLVRIYSKGKTRWVLDL